MLNRHQSGSNFLASLNVAFISLTVSPGIPIRNELAVCIPSSLQSLNARAVCSRVTPMLSFFKMGREPDSTPNQIVLHPALFISLKSSRDIKSTLVSQTHSISILFSLINLHISL